MRPPMANPRDPGRLPLAAGMHEQLESSLPTLTRDALAFLVLLGVLLGARLGTRPLARMGPWAPECRLVAGTQSSHELGHGSTGVWPFGLTPGRHRTVPR